MGISLSKLKGFFTVGDLTVSLHRSEADRGSLKKGDLVVAIGRTTTRDTPQALKERRQQLQELVDKLDKEIKDAEGQ